MVQMSRGYEDEHLILKVFLMFVNRADEEGRFGAMTREDESIELVRLSIYDLRVLLLCILFVHDKEMLQGYCLYDLSVENGK